MFNKEKIMEILLVLIILIIVIGLIVGGLALVTYSIIFLSTFLK